MTNVDRNRLVELREIFSVSRDDTDARREARKARLERDEIVQRLLKAFAAERGWLVTLKRFNLGQLALQKKRERSWFGGRLRLVEDKTPHGIIDHAECFREPKRPYRPVALLSHSYVTDREKHLEVARERGLAVEFLDWSWYYPESCLAALYVRM